MNRFTRSGCAHGEKKKGGRGRKGQGRWRQLSLVPSLHVAVPCRIMIINLSHFLLKEPIIGASLTPSA